MALGPRVVRTIDATALAAYMVVQGYVISEFIPEYLRIELSGPTLSLCSDSKLTWVDLAS